MITIDFTKNYKHVKRGSVYHPICIVSLQTSKIANADNLACVLYQSIDNPALNFVRPLNEFIDGRFVEV